jgi:hypothetical protein
MRVLAALTALLTLAIGVDAMQQRRAPGREAAVPFAAGETLTYDVSWSNLLTAGTAVTRVNQKRPSFGSTAWEITADGRPLPIIQRLYPVYYKMDTLLDSVSLLSQWSGLYLDENGRKRQTSMRFDRPTRKVHYEVTTAPAARAELTAPAGIQDGLSLLYVLRTRTFRAGDRFTVPVADDGSLYTVEFATSGPEKVSVRLGTLDAWRVNVTIVNEAKEQIGDDIVVWFATDARRAPVKIQAELPVGKFILALRQIQ